MIIHKLARNAGLIACILALVACAETQPSRFYSLSPATQAPEIEELTSSRIGLVPIILPEYLARPQIVTRSSPTTFEIAELERWIESFEAMSNRILIQNLNNLTGSDQVLLLPQRREIRFDWYVEIEIRRFDVGPDGMVLDARWSIFEGRSEQLAASNRSRIEIPVDPENTDRFDAIAQAMSEGFAQLSEEIAAGIAAENT